MISEQLLTDCGDEAMTERLAGQRTNHGRLADACVS